MNTTPTTIFNFSTLSARALHAAIKYHRLQAENMMQRISEEMRRQENGEEGVADRDFRRLIDGQIEHTEKFTAALREARARKNTTT